MIRFALLRHGRTDWNAEGRLQGQIDRPLQRGEPARLAALALPPEWREATLVSSTLSRAVDTARLVADRAPQTDARLVEMAFGFE